MGREMEKCSTTKLWRALDEGSDGGYDLGGLDGFASNVSVSLFFCCVFWIDRIILAEQISDMGLLSPKSKLLGVTSRTSTPLDGDGEYIGY